MKWYLVQPFGNPAVYHVCPLDSQGRPMDPLCDLKPGRRLQYPTGAIDCMECQSIAAQIGRNKQRGG